MTTATIDRCIADKTEMPGVKQRLERQLGADKAAHKKHGTVSVELKQGLTGARLARERGDVIEVPGDEAKRLIEAGIAIPIPQDKKRTATVSPPERRG